MDGGDVASWRWRMQLGVVGACEKVERMMVMSDGCCAWLKRDSDDGEAKIG